MTEALDRIGMSAESLMKLSPDEQFAALGSAINQISDPAIRAATAMDIFGRSGGEMLTVFSDGKGGLDRAAQQLGTQAAIMQKNANLFDRLSDDLGTAPVKLTGFFTGMADELAPVFEPLIKFFAETDFAASGQAFGRAIAVAVQSLTDGSIWSIMGLSALIAVRNVVNVLWKSLVTVFTAVGQLLLSQFMVGLEAFKVLASADFWVGVGAQILSWAARFNAMIFGVFVKIAEFLKPLLSKIGLGGVVDSFAADSKTEAEEQTQLADNMQSTANDKGTAIKDRLLGRLATEAENIASAFTDTYGQTADVLDNTDLQGALDEKIGDVMDKVQANYDKADRTTEGRKKTLNPDLEDEDEKGKKTRPEATRLMSLGGTNGLSSSMGLFMKNVLAKDPLLAESKKQTKAMEGVKSSVDRLADKLSYQPGGLKRFALWTTLKCWGSPGAGKKRALSP